MPLSLSRISVIESIIALLFAIAFCVYFIPAQNSFIRIHDTFDGNFTTRHVLIQSGNFFETDPNAVVPGIMNGLPRGVFPKFTEVTSIMMWLFGSLNGFAINFILLRLIAFLGIYLFARDHFGFKNDQKGMICLIAVSFACLPFFTIHGITVAGIPLLFWAFFNLLRNEKKVVSYLVFIMFALWANFVLVGVHAILCFGALAIYYSFKNKKFLLHSFAAVFVLAFTYILSEYMLFYMHWFNTSYQSSRGLFEKQLGLNFNGVIGNSMKLFFGGHYSASNYFGGLFVPFILFFVYDFFKTRDVLHKKGSLFIILAIAISIIASVLDWKAFDFFYEKFPIAKDFNLKRFYNFLPGLFFLIVACSVIAISNRNLRIRILSTIILGVCMIFIWRGNISYNNNGFNTMGLEIESAEKIRFKEFFDPELYKAVKIEFGADTLTNVIHFGISPSPSKYAGLNVLDDYQGDYPKAYKEQFREIIKGELDKSEGYKAYFDNWGARCYMWSANLFLGKTAYVNGILFEKELSINTGQIKKMHGKYILSSVIIGNNKDLNLKLKKILVSRIDLKKILLYELI